MSTPRHRCAPQCSIRSIWKPRGGFTLVELLISMSLALMLMAAILSSYVFLGRNFQRTLGIGTSNQPTLESQGRRTLQYFVQDVQSASAIIAPTASEVTLTIPTATGATTNVRYYYNSTPAPFPIGALNVPPTALVRIDQSDSSMITLHTNLLTCSFAYYDASGHPYTTYVNYLGGIKQISLVLTAQAGTSINNTLTEMYSLSSPRVLLRNKPMLP